MPVPYTFGTATSSIPLSQLDSNFATAITIGNTAVQLGNTVTTLNNLTLANVTISSGNVTVTNVAVTTANVSGTANVSTMVIIGNASVGGNTTVTGNISANNTTLTTSLTLSGGTANGVGYLNGSKVLTTGTAFVFDGTNVGIGTSSPSSYGLLTVLSSTAGSAKISIQDTSGGASPAPLVQFGVNSSNGFNTSDAARVWTTSASSTTAALNFAAYSGGAPSTAQMTLTSGNVGIGTSSPNASAILDAQSTTKGVRFPNMTTTQKNAVSSPPAGLVVFDTTLAKLCVYSGSAWQTITSV